MSERNGSARDAWDPQRYGRFAAERSEPFWDLVALIEPSDATGGFGRSADLGCGSGELTAAVTDHLGIHEMVGVDSSDVMLTAARAAVGDADDRLRFARGDIAQWTSRGDHDLVIANASLQWVPDHAAVLGRWWAALVPGGQLAVQMPANSDHPAQLVAAQVAATEPFLSAFNQMPPPDPVAQNVLPLDQYSAVLEGLGAAARHVRMQVYDHHLAWSGDMVEWMRATALTRFLRLLPADLGEQLVAAYRDELLAVIGDVRPYHLTYKRILMWARKPY